MSKVLILGFAKVAYMPYLNFYLESLDKETEIHLVTWQRDQKRDKEINDTRVKMYVFTREQKDEVLKIGKIWNFYRYRRYVLKIMNQNRYDRVIVLHTLPGVIMADKLLKHFQGRFLFDYRDYTYEGFAPFRKIVGNLVEASYATFVSSDAFREALPKTNNIYTSHNLLVDSLQHREVRNSLPRERSPIRIAFWGFIRHEGINCKLIQALGNDQRFELHYYGREQQTALHLKQLVQEQHFTNVFFHGAYSPNDRYCFAAQTDLIHNMYENDAGTQKAMGNKYYDGVVFRIPQLCTKDSFMGERVSREGVGYEVGSDFCDLGNQIKQYYDSLNWSNFNKACDCTVNKIVEEYGVGREKIREFGSEPELLV